MTACAWEGEEGHVAPPQPGPATLWVVVQVGVGPCCEKTVAWSNLKIMIWAGFSWIFSDLESILSTFRFFFSISINL